MTRRLGVSRVTRRAAMAVAAVGLLVPLAACGSGSSKDAGGNGGGPSADPSTYDRTATIRVGTPSPFSALDPAKQANIGENTYTFLIYDTLTQMDADYQVQPMLATSWEFAADGSSLTLKLRDDVTFNDGAAFDAEVVKTNIERGKTMEGSSLVAALAPIDRVVVEDPYTVRLDLVPGLGADLPATFALNAGMMVSPKALAERADELALDPGTAGSGPYVPVEVKTGEQVTFERSDDYWNEDTAYAATLVVRTVADQAARLNGVQTGALDVAQISGSAPVQEALALVERGAVQGDKIAQITPVILMVNAERGDLAKPEVREAIGLAVNRTEIVEGLFSGNASPATQFYPEDYWAADPDLAAPEPDLEAAKALVEKAGGAEISIAAATGSTAEPVAQALQTQLGAVGIEVDLQSIPFAQIDEMYRRGELDAQVINASPAPDPASTLSYYVTDGFAAARGFGDVLGTLPAEAADPTKSLDERAAKYREIWKVMADNDMWTPIVRGEQVWVRSEKIANVPNLPWVRSGFPSYRNVAMVK
ncbi:ABC transporter substrate-binding protein [Nocardioides sp. L-11A]|uniref:ABC transporter substrate-binding protein n=1 Tax=Nocardioides sp. L-11A TaxID=3043848 RepID=UPI00249CDC87|nr:ABC transporter substrate-binding protein [Nocardioides sp. L-11A]